MGAPRVRLVLGLARSSSDLQDGLLRLDRPVLPVWNTPRPPSLALINKAFPADDAPCQNLYAVQMDEVKGITFFFRDGMLVGFHIH